MECFTSSTLLPAKSDKIDIEFAPRSLTVQRFGPGILYTYSATEYSKLD